MDWGVLHLSTAAGDIPQAVWADVSMNRILTVAMLVIVLVCLQDFFQLAPLLSGCLVRSRGNIEIEHSVSQARNRNRCAFAGLGILSLLADRYGLYPAAFVYAAAPGWRVPILFGVFCLFAIFHRIVAGLIRKNKLDNESRAACTHAVYNYFLATLPLMLVSVAVLWLFKAGDSAIRAVLLAEIFAVLMITLLREGQILSSKYSPLQTFLYLCGLEFIPLAALIAPAVVLQ